MSGNRSQRGEAMIVTMIPYCPRSEGTNLGFAYNELMGRLRDEDWACFIDHDACFTTPDWYAATGRNHGGPDRALRVDRHDQPRGLALAACARRRSRQPCDGLPSAGGKAVQARVTKRALRDVTHESLMSGVVILLSKKTWSLLGGFADGFLGVDNAIHQAARDRGCRVYLMEGVYVYHWYRADAISAGSLWRLLAHRDASNGRCEAPAAHRRC